MLRTLAIIAGVSLLVSALCLAGAASLASADIAKSGFGAGRGWEGWINLIERRLESELERGDDWDGAADSGEQTSRELAWDGAGELSFVQGGEVRFRQGAERRVVVTGPARLVERLVMSEGAIVDRETLESGRLRRGGDLSIEITAPDIEKFNVIGSADVAIENFDRPNLTLSIVGSGDVTMSGTARTLDLTILGSGDADAAGIAAETARVHILGSGGATIAPTQAAEIQIAGSGDVTLLSNPPSMRNQVHGSGEIIRQAPAPDAHD